MQIIYKTIIVILLIAVGALLGHIGFFDLLADPWERMDFYARLLEHIKLVGYSMFFAILTGFLLGVICSRETFKKYSATIQYIAGLGQIIPTLAILALGMAIFGIGQLTAIITLFVVSIIPILRNTLVGLNGIPAPVLDAARGLGMPHWHILTEIEIPNALPLIIAGIRVAFIINIGTAALGYLIGAGGLGEIIFTGIQVQETNRLLLGCIPVILSALIVDYTIGIISNLIIPKGIR